MDALGWDSCDIIIVCGDAYVDHPSFGMAVIGRFLESQGFRVGIIAQPDWRSAEDFKALGKPNLFFGVSAGNMDSMINRYTADLKVRNDDAYTPGGEPGKRPDRAVIVYSHGHSRHVCNSGCRYYRAPRRAVVVYRHGHSRHVCNSSCASFRVGVGVGRGGVRVFVHGHRNHRCNRSCSYYGR